jgi:hypothetical protein
MENPTIVVLTDRTDLDDQLFGTFSRCAELLRQPPVQAESRAHLRELLSVAAVGVVFTTIHKFFPEEKGDRHPTLSERRNIVVIADEAHRSQHDSFDGFARHMRDALPYASFIGFTGTPVELADANTRAVLVETVRNNVTIDWTLRENVRAHERSRRTTACSGGRAQLPPYAAPARLPRDSRTIFVRMPSLDNIPMSISALNRSMRPRIRSLTRGWVTPRSSATAACFIPRAAITACSFAMSSERILRWSASSTENPRSRNTFPLDRDRRRSAITHLLPLTSLVDQRAKAILRELHIFCRRPSCSLPERV